MDYFTSDLHFFHDKEFIYKPRGFNSEEEMRYAYLAEIKNTVKENDNLHIVSDVCLGQDLDKIKEVLSSLPGKIHIYIGNHDTQSKIDLYKSLPNVVEVVYANEIKHGKRTYYVSHYRTDVSCLECSPKTSKINIHGHIHTKQIHYEDIPYFINVSVDAQNGKLVTFDDIEKMFDKQVKKCISNL